MMSLMDFRDALKHICFLDTGMTYWEVYSMGYLGQCGSLSALQFP